MKTFFVINGESSHFLRGESAKRWILALAILALCIGTQWADLYIEQTFKVPATIVAFWSTYVVFPVSGYIVGRIKPLWMAAIALITVLAGDDLACGSLFQVLAILDPKVNEMDFPDMIMGFYMLPAVVMSIPAFIVGAALAYLKDRRARRTKAAVNAF